MLLSSFIGFKIDRERFVCLIHVRTYTYGVVQNLAQTKALYTVLGLSDQTAMIDVKFTKLQI